MTLIRRQKWHDEYLPRAVRELAIVSRNHPSVCRYSLMNESRLEWMPSLIDAIREEDPTRPLVFEDNEIDEPARIDGTDGHAYAMLHYVNYPKPARIITGMGEYAWRGGRHDPAALHAGGGLEEFIYYGAEMRRWDLAYIAAWDFINYWPNFLEGMSFEKHAWKQSTYPQDRVDGVDGWGSPVIAWARKYFHPYLVLDIGIHEMNTPGSDLAQWPQFTSSYSPGSEITRELEVFNDGLRGSEFKLKWEARWDSMEGPLVDSGTVEALSIAPGFHRTVQVSLTAPETAEERRLLLVLRSLLEGGEVFVNENVYFWIRVE